MDMEKIYSLFNEPAHFSMSIPELINVLGTSEQKIRKLIRDMDLDECPITSCPDLIFKKGNLYIFTTNTPYYVFRTSIIKLANALMDERLEELNREIEKRNREIAAAEIYGRSNYSH